MQDHVDQRPMRMHNCVATRPLRLEARQILEDLHDPVWFNYYMLGQWPAAAVLPCCTVVVAEAVRLIAGNFIATTRLEFISGVAAAARGCYRIAIRTDSRTCIQL